MAVGGGGLPSVTFLADDTIVMGNSAANINTDHITTIATTLGAPGMIAAGIAASRQNEMMEDELDLEPEDNNSVNDISEVVRAADKQKTLSDFMTHIYFKGLMSAKEQPSSMILMWRNLLFFIYFPIFLSYCTGSAHRPWERRRADWPCPAELWRDARSDNFY